MKQKTGPDKAPAHQVKDIRRQTVSAGLRRSVTIGRRYAPTPIGASRNDK